MVTRRIDGDTEVDVGREEEGEGGVDSLVEKPVSRLDLILLRTKQNRI